VSHLLAILLANHPVNLPVSHLASLLLRANLQRKNLVPKNPKNHNQSSKSSNKAPSSKTLSKTPLRFSSEVSTLLPLKMT
jgi:hypothetical protein